MTQARYIPRNLKIHQVASTHAKAHDSDPFAYARMTTHLKNQCCAQGMMSEVEEDATRILNARAAAKRNEELEA